MNERPRVRTEVQVMFFDTDCGAVVHNIAYLRFIEIARTFLAEQLGLHLAEMAETQRYPVVVRTEIDYKRAAKLADKLMIEGWLDEVERVRFWCAFAAGALELQESRPRLARLLGDEAFVEGWWTVAQEAEWALRCLDGEEHPPLPDRV